MISVKKKNEISLIDISFTVYEPDHSQWLRFFQKIGKYTFEWSGSNNDWVNLLREKKWKE